ncbi:DUF3037 domain-containing protein [Luteimonas sp. R10]|uniref:DUF3037 domain-containing protein n=1 Tax=Luteimonas sp. R10 TaxID=3108176 RepID=UPI00308E8C7D|nr:DUF3037 domain-containing protein [Luteimonas sp. R10]
MHAHLYDYAVIRVVPRVEREEFVNVGVLLSCPALGFLDAAVAPGPERLRALDPTLDLDALRRHLDAIVAVCRGGPDSGPIGRLPPRARFHSLTARRSAVIQMSPVHTGQCDADPALTLQRLMQRMVLPPAPTGSDAR